MEDPGVRQGGQQGDGAELPVVAEDGRAEEALRVEDPEVAVGEKPAGARYIRPSEVLVPMISMIYDRLRLFLV